MERTIYTPEQIKELLANPNVDSCSPKSITYNKGFKLLAIKQYYEEGLSPRTIFKKAGFDLAALGKYKPENCLKLWRKVYQNKGEAGLAEELRGKNSSGRKKRPNNPNDPDYLKAKIAYLEAENDFLKKLKTKTNH